MRIVAACVLLSALAACGRSDRATLADLAMRDVTLPGGRIIHAELATTPAEMERGLMFRTSLAPDRGMLFVFQQEGKTPFWMFQTLIPLDMIWMDSRRRIVEISADTPPCRTDESQCPSYGGHQLAQFVLELNGGAAAKYHLKIGDELSF
jgi:hypothetical protein